MRFKKPIGTTLMNLTLREIWTLFFHDMMYKEVKKREYSVNLCESPIEQVFALIIYLIK